MLKKNTNVHANLKNSLKDCIHYDIQVNNNKLETLSLYDLK